MISDFCQANRAWHNYQECYRVVPPGLFGAMVTLWRPHIDDDQVASIEKPGTLETIYQRPHKLPFNFTCFYQKTMIYWIQMFQTNWNELTGATLLALFVPPKSVCVWQLFKSPDHPGKRDLHTSFHSFNQAAVL